VTEETAAEVLRKPRIFLNGFPKSGLHLAVLMVRTITQEAALHPAWTGCFTHNSWSTNWAPIPQVMAGLRCLRDDTWLKGHMGYLPVYEQYMYWHGVAKAFIYRDPRDVLVSQSYHVASADDKKFFHPNKAIYREMDHESRLMACLCGVEEFAGLFDRWVLYAPWLGVPWVFKLRFEDMMERREETVRAFLKYTWDRTTWGLVQPFQPTEIMDAMTEATMKNMEIKPDGGTFRKGHIGDWREEFTPRVVEEFKARAGDWLIRLGYEKDNDWGL
jgi:hypothetical protein